MAIEVRNQEWLDHNRTRRYPLAQEATGADVTGTFRIPNDFLVSLYLAVPATFLQGPAGFHIKTIHAFSSGYGVVIGYRGTSVASASIVKAGFQRNSPFRIFGLGDYRDVSGVLVVGSLESIERQPSGSFEFSEADGRLEVDCIRPDLRRILSIQLQNGQELSERLYDDVVLQAGRNIRLLLNRSVYPPVITIDAIEGEGLNAPCPCRDTETVPIRTINGVPPNSGGDFTLMGASCLELEPMANGLRLRDTCAQPCCGSEELKTLTQALETLRNQVATLEGHVAQMENSIAAMDAALFASKIGDGICPRCQ